MSEKDFFLIFNLPNYFHTNAIYNTFFLLNNIITVDGAANYLDVNFELHANEYSNKKQCIYAIIY